MTENKAKSKEEILDKHEWLPTGGWTKKNMLDAMEEYAQQQLAPKWVADFIKGRIESLKEVDADLCKVRWDATKGNTERFLARERSNETTAIRHELEALLKHISQPAQRAAQTDLPNLDKSTENWSKIKDKDEWLKEIRGGDVATDDDWISVEDRLPENKDYVLVYDRIKTSGAYIKVSMYSTTYGFESSYKPTHWRPLPKPPKQCTTTTDL